jgi:phosphatidate cytidylyltransferase
MKRILTAAFMIPLVLVLVFLPSKFNWVFTAAVALVAALAAWELLGLTERGGVKPPRVAVLVALMALFAVNFQWPDFTPAVFGVLGLALLVYCTFFRPIERVMGDASASIFCMLYIGFTLIALPALREESNGPSVVTFLLCVVWCGDIAALYVGRAWGRLKMAPSISPAKSWEGALGSMAGSLLAAGALLGLAALLQHWDLTWLSYPEEYTYWLLLAVLINVAAQVGDLAESALKRSAGVKDSGSLLPGHGGMLDRIDALLLAAPVLWYALDIHKWF